MAKLVTTWETIEKTIHDRSDVLMKSILPLINNIVMCDIKIENGLVGNALESVQMFRKQSIDDLMFQINHSNTESKPNPLNQ